MGAPGKPNPASRENGKLGGRPVATKTLETQTIRKRLVERFSEKADELFDAWEDLALGHYQLIEQPDGTAKVYKTAPNPKALKDLIDQTIGKASQQIDVSGSLGNNIIQIENALIALANDTKTTQNPELSEGTVQGREREADDTNRDTVQNLRADIQEILVESSSNGTHPIREVASSSTGDSN